ncbi:methyltransferase type 11 [Diplogelasinospora grovesii]|uniref:Methyltransferase type 11 n=1 Tax=Diplogelasinospora grovesii TaxID=303347 RepID=A0AAN6RYX8_9PEZI|nr:methyltransferase type 11 [Diplogelasinospora grovesii]
MSQYDSIGSKYNIFKTLPASVLETFNLHCTLHPFLSGARVLDLACGTGYYSQKLLEWGASCVLGVDISQEMISIASSPTPHLTTKPGRVTFRVGNALTLGKLPDHQPFDIVLDVWLLNYSDSCTQLTQMFRTISANLSPRGIFIGITPHPVSRDNFDAWAERINLQEKENPAKWGLGVRYYEKLASGEGYKTRVYTQPQPQTDNDSRPVEFYNYHLCKEVYKRAAREGGLHGELEWREVKLPPEALAIQGEEYWTEYFTEGLHMGVLVVHK